MIDRLNTQFPAAAMICIVALLSSLHWYLDPERQTVWVLLIVGMGVAFLATFIVQKHADKPRAKSDFLFASLFGAATVLMATLSVSIANELGWASDGMEKRIVGIIISTVLIVTGNFLPKTVSPVADAVYDPAKARAADRFAGRMCVIAGLIGVVGWVVLSTDHAKLLFAVCGLAAVSLTFFKWFTTVRGSRPNNQNGT